ncbi:plastocyanin/azurin family copper-binding protein [Pontibacter qinzhouensis]|nr:plastocyanin/azurin family copper-binding protein [Pontibacter qinzhouensis]
MSYSAKAKGSAMFSFVAAGVALALTACSSGSGEEKNSLESAALNNDTARTEEVGNKKAMQPVVEVTIRTVGDEKTGKHYDTDTIEAKAGELLKISLVNEGSEQSMIHNIVFTRAGKSTEVALAGAKVGAPGNYVPDDTLRVLAASPLALPGQTVVLEFQVPKEPGQYDYVCTYPEHYKFMKGVLLVK